MAVDATGARVVFFGSHKHPSYVVEKCDLPGKDGLRKGEMLVKILMATICPMDLDHISGDREVKTPCILGHEGVGEVVCTQRNTAELPVALVPGDRVVFTMVNKCCCCCMCREEMRECCSQNVKYGCSLTKDGLNGTFSTHIVLKAGTHVTRVPSNVSNTLASPANCALATMVNAVTYLTSHVAFKNSVAVIQGANLMGLYGCALLNEAGFSQVYCHDISSARLKLVPKFGGISVLVDKEYDFEEPPSDPERNTADVVIDVCGAWDVVAHGLSVLKHGGIYMFVGSPHDERPLSINIDLLLKKCISVKGIRGYDSEHLDKAMEFLSQTTGRYPFDDETLISPPYSLQEFHIAVGRAHSKMFYRVAVVPQL